MTDQQRKIANYLRNGTSQTQAAKKLKITRQAVSRHVQSSGWQYYWEAETAWKTILKEYIDPLIGSSK
jgi:predicted transcriptional regulator